MGMGYFDKYVDCLTLVWPSYFFCNTSNQGGCYNPSLDFPNRTIYEIDFGINR